MKFYSCSPMSGICIRAAYFSIIVFIAGVTRWQGSTSLAVQPGKTLVTQSTLQKTKEGILEPAHISIEKSRVYIFVDKTGLGHQHGVEGRLKSGHIHLNAVEKAGELEFDMNSFDADTDAARKYVGLEGSTDSSTRMQVNDNMKNTAVLNVRAFPTAVFAIKSATKTELKSSKGFAIYELAGEFTLRGRSRPLTFHAEVEQKNGMTHIRGNFNILQSQYGITPFRKALGAVGVADQLTIHGDLWVAAE